MAEKETAASNGSIKIQLAKRLKGENNFEKYIVSGKELNICYNESKCILNKPAKLFICFLNKNN